MSTIWKSYFGWAAQLAAMAELTRRGYETAIPGVDVGDDIIVWRPGQPVRFAVQVKGRTAKERRRLPASYSHFIISTKQLLTERKPELVYALSMLVSSTWETVVISRRELLAAWAARHGRLPRLAQISLHVGLHHDRVLVGGNDFQKYRNNWDRYFPDLLPHNERE